MKALYCPSCGRKVAEIEPGSKIKKDAVMICGTCNTKRIALDLKYSPNVKQNQDNSISSLFKDIFERR